MRLLMNSTFGRRSLFSALLSFALGVSGHAAAEEFPGWFAAYISGSDRLALYAAGQEGVQDVIPQLVYRTGGMHKGPTPQIIARDIGVRPILYYASNFNGGIPGQHIELGGLQFTVDEESRAKNGLVAGASIYGGVIASYRTGSTVQLGVGGSAEWLAGEGQRRQQANVSLCAEHHLTGWTWLDGCISTVRVLRSYDTNVSQHDISLGPTIVYQTGGLSQQFGLRGTRTFMEDGPQNGIEADWIGSFPNIGAINVGLQLAEELEGENTQLRGLDLGIVRPIANRPVNIALNYNETGGYILSGKEREDQVITVSVRAPINEKWRVNGFLGKRRSNFDAYDETIGRVSFDLTKW